MAKQTSRYMCDSCGAESAQWLGKCSACGEWNTLVEVKVRAAKSAAVKRGLAQEPVALTEVAAEREPRKTTGMGELDRVLGGGVVAGGLVLLAGDPGIGKSTLLLQCANSFAGNHGACLYVSGEESLGQVAMRSRRIEPLSPELLLLAEMDVEQIESQVERTRPQLLIVDSVQALYSAETDSLPGSPSQVRECATRLLRVAKDLGVPTFLVGHVTKDGSVAGPRLLEHMVDTVLALEGDRHSGHRILRTTKNRFGSTDEIGMFQMTEGGLEGVPDASAALLAERRAGVPGSSVAAAVEGSRPLLVEIQALVSAGPAYGTPRRSVTGVDYNRTCLILAVLEKRAGMSLGSQDVFVNVPGGIRVTEPALDLGVALAVASSVKDQALPEDLACIGEIGLTGEVRSVPRLAARLNELSRRGFRKCLVPAGSGERGSGGMSLMAVENVQDAFRLAF
ncbi:MAG: DNA repair protein RadA [Armatimonadota bacterium]